MQVHPGNFFARLGVWKSVIVLVKTIDANFARNPRFGEQAVGFGLEWG
jgi:hypothetical protein